MGEKVRLNLEITKETYDEFRLIGEIEGCSFTTIIRQGIALLKIARDAKQDGKHFGLSSDMNNLDTVIVGIFA